MNNLSAIGYRAFITAMVLWWAIVFFYGFVLIPDSASQALYILVPPVIVASSTNYSIPSYPSIRRLCKALLFTYAPLAGFLVAYLHTATLGGAKPSVDVGYLYAAVVIGPWILLALGAGLLTFILGGPKALEDHLKPDTPTAQTKTLGTPPKMRSGRLSTQPASWDDTKRSSITMAVIFSVASGWCFVGGLTTVGAVLAVVTVLLLIPLIRRRGN